VDSKEFYTMEEVLSIAKELALDIDERTFKYYLSLEIISKPVKNPYPDGDKRVKFYPAIVLEQLKKIFQLKNRGFSLKQIKKLVLEEKSQELDVLVDVTEKDEKREIAHAFLEVLSGEESRRAWRDFISASVSDLSEKNLLDSTKTYMLFMLRSWLKADEAEKYVDEFLISRSQEEREEILEPFRTARDEELSRIKIDKPDLLRYLQKLCGRIILGRYNKVEVEIWLNAIVESLQKTQKNYEPRNDGDTLKDEIHAFMQKALDLYLEALEEIKENISSKKREVLIAALGKARSAHDIITGLEEIIEKRKMLSNLGA
jgi:DNA-binding transcriptional MerR regulator